MRNVTIVLKRTALKERKRKKVYDQSASAHAKPREMNLHRLTPSEAVPSELNVWSSDAAKELEKEWEKRKKFTC